MTSSTKQQARPGAIIIGASSGVGRELAVQLHAEGYAVAVTARREDRLLSLCDSLKEHAFAFRMDVSDIDQAIEVFHQAWKKLGSVELVIVNAGVGDSDPTDLLKSELYTLDVNVTGFTAIANQAFAAFKSQGFGHLVGISSVAGVRGGTVSVYHASKAFVSNYLEGLAIRAFADGNQVTVTDVRPGFVDTVMAQGDHVFWMASVERACRQIIAAIRSKKRVVYVTRRWRLIAWLMKCMPFFIYKRIMKASLDSR